MQELRQYSLVVVRFANGSYMAKNMVMEIDRKKERELEKVRRKRAIVATNGRRKEFNNAAAMVASPGHQL